MRKMRNIYIFRPVEFYDELQVRTDNKWYLVNDTAWDVIKARWIDKECDSIRVMESGNDTLIVTINVKKKKEKD